MKIIYKDGVVAECPQEEELHVLRHTAAHIMAWIWAIPSSAMRILPTSKKR